MSEYASYKAPPGTVRRDNEVKPDPKKKNFKRQKPTRGKKK